MSQIDQSKILNYNNKLKVVHKVPPEETEKEKNRRDDKYTHWKMPVERPGYIKSKKHDCL